MSKAFVVWINCPDTTVAQAIAESLIERRLAACVNCLPPVTSIYRWEGEIERATEVPLMIKTSAARYAEVEDEIRRLHPYDVPEIIGLPVEAGDPAYLAWIADETDPAVRT